MKKQLLILSTELIAYILIGLLIGRFLDYSLDLKGWGTLGCVTLVYLLWFIKFYKRLRQKL